MKFVRITWAFPLVTMIAACATPSTEQKSAVEASAAHAKLLASDGTGRGDAKVTQAADGLHVLIRAKGLTPGLHAVHVHTTGICTAPDFASAGGHWNPVGRQHGRENPQGMHMGDMPNMLIGSDGAGEMEYVIRGGLVNSGAAPLLDTDGAAVVIHAQADDNKTDPAGNAGGRVACGVVVAG